MRRLILASGSSARLRLLRSAGMDPEVVVSGVDEDGVTAATSAELSLILAARKTAVVAAQFEAGPDGPVVVGCDSVLDQDGITYGKPAGPEEARRRWHDMRGRPGVVWTGHSVHDRATGRQAERTLSTTVYFGEPSDAEIDAYVATGEPLAAAGAFTLHGRGAPFVLGVDGDPGNVQGISLPLLRELLREVGVQITDLWAPVP